MRARLLFLLLLVAACVPKHHVVMNRGGMAIGASLGMIDDGPYRLLFGGPKGSSTHDAEITLAFSRSISTTEAPASVVREDDRAPVFGTWQWFGESAAVFHPEKRFARATSYRVVPRDGFEPFTFATERPILTRVSYDYDEKKNAHLVSVTFDQTVTARSASEAIRIEDSSGKRIPFEVLDENQGLTLTLQADPSVARLENVAVIATTAVRGIEGPLGPEAETKLPLEGVGPFKVKLTCTKCDVNEPIRLEATRTFNERDLLRRLVIAGPSKANTEEVKYINERNPSLTTMFDLGTLLSVEPGKKYKVTLKAGLVADDKERLANDQVFEFETLDLPASLAWRDVTAKVMTVESARKFLPIAVFATNVPTFDVVSAPLDERGVEAFLAAPKPTLPKGAVATVVTDAPKNVLKEYRVNIAENRPAGASGAWVVATHTAGLEDDVRLLSMTDFGVTTKWSPHGALVWVTRLSNAEPVVGAKVTLRDWATTTDREGIALIPPAVVATFLHEDDTEKPPAILFVRKDSDWTFTRLPELNASLMSAVGYAFVERGLYRPGETVLAKGYFRMPGPRGLTNLAGKTVYVEALDAADHIFGAQTATLDAFGAFSAEIPIPKSVRMGRSFLRARVGSRAPANDREPRRSRWAVDHHWPARDGFMIDTFRTPELKVETKLDRESIVRGEKVTVTTTGNYLLGAPMTNVPVNVEITRSRTSFRPTGLEEFSADDSGFGESPKPSEIPRPHLEGKLDSKGVAIFDYPFPDSKTLARAETYTFSADIGDVSRAFSMSDSASLLIHPSDTYLGIKANRGTPPLIPGKMVRAELVAATIHGQRTATSAKIELFRASEENEPVTTGRSCNVTTELAKLATCDFTVTAKGKHWLRATAMDASGRAIAAAEAFVVLPKNTQPTPPPEPVPPPPPPLPFDEECKRPRAKGAYVEALSVENRREPYRVGENALACARLTPTPPVNARGLLTLEREGILRREPIFEFHGADSRLLRIPVTEELYPNVHVAFAEAIGRVAPLPSPGRSDSGPPSFTGVSQRLAVTVPAKKLAVAIETPKEARPGSEIELRVNVEDGDRRPTVAQVTLWAVDEGIHLLVPKRVPAPEETFGEERSSDVVESDTRANIFYEHGKSYRTKSPSLRQGSTAVSDRNLVGRSVFRPTAFFLTNVITGANGTATVRAKLPDNLTTWKVFAVAATASDAFGGGEASFTTNKPLMIRPQLPRFLRAKDRFEATVMIDSLVKEPIDLALSVRTSGVLASKSARTTVHIPAEGHVPVRIPIEARGVGAGKVVFEGTSTQGPSFRDEVTVEEEVGALASIESVTMAGEIPASKSPVIIHEPLGDLSKVRPEIGGLDYRFSTTPLVGLAASLRELIEYPYGCTEQLTSRLVPLIRLRGLAKDLGVELPSNVDASVRSSLSSLLTHQQPDGGFGFWRESTRSEPWLTLLALGALRTAEQQGYVVPASSVEAAQKWLEKPTEGRGEAITARPLDSSEMAMREDLFASFGKARPTELRGLAADPKLPLFARALVAHGLAGVDRDLAKSVLNGILANAQAAGAVVTFVDEPSLVSRPYLSSNARTTALALRAMLAIDAKNPLVVKTIRGLLALRHDGRWRTTQDSAWALAALDDARAMYRAAPGRTSAEFLFDRHVVATTVFAGLPSGETRSGTIAMSRLLGAPGAAVSFESDGTHPLYYEGALRYARVDPPLSPLDHGLTVARSLRPLRAGATEFAVGDYVIADLIVVTNVPRDLVVLDDPIPAGFEAVNGQFASMDGAAPLVVDPAPNLTHRELHDDRVVSFFDALPAGVTHTRYVLRTIATGHFAHPPARAECMYAPDIFGRTASTWVDTR